MPVTERRVDAIERQLREAGTPKRAFQGRRYPKSDLRFLDTGGLSGRSQTVTILGSCR